MAADAAHSGTTVWRDGYLVSAKAAGSSCRDAPCSSEQYCAAPCTQHD